MKEPLLAETQWQLENEVKAIYRVYLTEAIVTFIDKDGREFSESFSRHAFMKDKNIIIQVLNRLATLAKCPRITIDLDGKPVLPGKGTP